MSSHLEFQHILRSDLLMLSHGRGEAYTLHTAETQTLISEALTLHDSNQKFVTA